MDSHWWWKLGALSVFALALWRSRRDAEVRPYAALLGYVLATDVLLGLIGPHCPTWWPLWGICDAIKVSWYVAHLAIALRYRGSIHATTMIVVPMSGVSAALIGLGHVYDRARSVRTASLALAVRFEELYALRFMITNVASASFVCAAGAALFVGRTPWDYLADRGKTLTAVSTALCACQLTVERNKHLLGLVFYYIIAIAFLTRRARKELTNAERIITDAQDASASL